MEQRRLGTNGPQIPAIMFGAWPIGGGMGAVDEALAIATIQHALDLGVAAIDTAEFYQVSETVIGRALAGHPREQVFIATKVSSRPYTRAHIREKLEDSLRALGTDYVDLYQLHSYPTETPLEEAMAGLADVKDSGKARFVGVSNFTVEQLAAAVKHYPVQSLQPRFNVFDAQAADDLLPYCLANGIGVIAHSALAKGLLTGKYRPDHVFADDDERSRFPRFQGETFVRFLAVADELAAMAQRKNATLVQLAIAWALAHAGVTSCIVGAKTPAQVDEQIGALDIRLSSEEVERIRRMALRATRDLG